MYYISGGKAHSLGVKTDGTVVGAGSETYNRRDVGLWTDIISVAAGNEHSAGLKSDGTVVAVGRTNYNQTDVSGWSGAIGVAVGDDHTLAVISDGTVVGAGRNTSGQINVSGWVDITRVSAGSATSFGLKSDGTVVAVGSNMDGQLNVEGWTSIIKVESGFGHTLGLKSDGTVVGVGWNGNDRLDVGGWTNIVDIACGDNHSVGLKSDGTVVAVGYDFHGQTDVSGWIDIVAIAAGGSFTLGLKSDGTVVGTGQNTSGQINVSGWTDIARPPAPPPPVTYAGTINYFTLTLTGSAPFENVLLPSANFLARIRSARRSYLQVTIPYTSEYAEQIADRAAGDLQLRWHDHKGDAHVVLTVKLDGIQITQGVQSSSIVLTGWRQSTNNSPATHADIKAATVSSGTTAGTMTMPGYRPEIKPADTVEANGVSFVANLVTVQGAARRNDIEVRTTMSEEATV